MVKHPKASGCCPGCPIHPTTPDPSDRAGRGATPPDAIGPDQALFDSETSPAGRVRLDLVRSDGSGSRGGGVEWRQDGPNAITLGSLQATPAGRGGLGVEWCQVWANGVGRG